MHRSADLDTGECYAFHMGEAIPPDADAVATKACKA